MSGTDVLTYAREAPGMSGFAFSDGVVYHTYSAYARGLDPLWGMYRWLDRAPKGRNETGLWFRRHDEYIEVLNNGRHIKRTIYDDNNQAGAMTDTVVNLSCGSVVIRTKPSCLVIADVHPYTRTLSYV